MATKPKNASAKSEAKTEVATDAPKGTSRKTSPAVAVVNAGEVVLKQIQEATAAGSFVFTSPAIHKPLIEAGLVEINEEIKNEAGEVATRAIIKGDTMTNAATEVKAQTGKFAIDADIPVPTIKRGGRGGNMYPFDDLLVNQSFFVPATEKKPEPAKSLASTVSSATARYAVAVEGQTKKDKKGNDVPVTENTRVFVVRSVDETAAGRGVGARVWRTK